MRKCSNFCTRGGFQATVYRAKFKNSYVFLMTNYDIYANYKPILFYLLVSFMIGVVTQLTNSFLLWYYSWNSCELWVKLSIVLMLFMVYISYIMHLSPSLLHDLVFVLAWWYFTLLLSNCKTKTLKTYFT